MSELSVCIICVRSDRALKTIEMTLFSFHEELCDYSIPSERKALYCSECIWYLRKFCKFKQKCVKADKVLRMWNKVTPHMKSYVENQLTPSPLGQWDGRNSKTFHYVYVDRIYDASTINAPNTFSKDNNATASTYKISVKKFTPSDILNSQSTIKTNNAVKLLNPTVNMTHDNMLYSLSAVSENTVEISKPTVITKNGDIMKCLNILQPLLKTTKEEVIIDNEDPLIGFDVLDTIKPSNDNDVNDNDGPHHDHEDDDNKDDIKLLDDDKVPNNSNSNNKAQDIDVTNFGSIAATPVVKNTYHRTKNSTSDVNNKTVTFSDVDNKIISGINTNATPLELKNRSHITNHTKKYSDDVTDGTVSIGNENAMKTTVSDIPNENKSEINNDATRFIVGSTTNSLNNKQLRFSYTIPEPSNEVSIFTEPHNHHELVINTDVKEPIVTQSNKENKYLIHPCVKQYHGPKHVVQRRSVDSLKLIKEEHCYGNDRGDITATGIFLNDNCDTNSAAKSSVKTKPISTKTSYYPETVRVIQKLSAIEIEQMCKIKNKKINIVPIKKVPRIDTKVKVNSQNIDRDKYIHYENGVISLRFKKTSKIVKNLKKKNYRNMTKLEKKVAVKKPMLSKKAKRYANLLAFVNPDKIKSKNEGAEEEDINLKEMSDVTSKESETLEDSDLKKVEEASIDTEPKLYENFIYPQDLFDDAGNKLTGPILCEKQGVLLSSPTDKPRKTLTELTNIDINSDDQDIKVLCINKKEEPHSFKENNDTKIFNFADEIVEFAPDVVANEEIIENEGIYENDISNEKENNQDANENKGDNNEAARKEEEVDENKDKNKEEIENTDDDSEAERLSSKFAGQLMIRKLYHKFNKVIKEHEEIKTADGKLLNKEGLVGFFMDMTYKDKWRVAKAMAEIDNRTRTFLPEAVKILWKLQQKYVNKYSGIFDLVYLNTEEKMLKEFLKRRTYHAYVKAKVKCELCVQPFHNEHTYQFHMKWHDALNGEHECIMCHTWYKTKKMLNKHKQRHAVVYKCKLCPMVTHKKNIMMSHCMHHWGKKVTCNICGEKYSHGASYATHRMLHSSSHECNMCARNFASDIGLTMHKRMKHAGLDEKDFPEPTKCEVCDITYSTQEVYMKHYKKEHDPNGRMLRTVRNFGAKWRHKKERPAPKEVDPNNPKRRNRRVKYIPNLLSDEERSKLVMTNEPRGLYAAKTFAAATAAIKLARERNMMLQTGESYQETLNEIRDAASSISQQLTNFEDDIGAATVIKRTTAPSYEKVSQVINAKRKTKIQSDKIDENYEENEESAHDMPQNFDAITQNVEHESEQSFDNTAADEVISTRVINLKHLQQKYNKHGTARIIPKVANSTHKIRINKHKELDMPQLLDTTSEASPEHSMNDINLKGGKWKPIMPQVFDTMSRDADVSSSIGNPAKNRHVRGKWRPNMLKVNDYAVASNINDTRDVNAARNKRRPKMPLVFDTMSRNEGDNSMNIECRKRKLDEYDTQQVFSTSHDINTLGITKYNADAASSKINKACGRNKFAGKRRPQTANTHKNVEEDVTHNYEIVYPDAASSKSNNTDENVFKGKRKPQLVDVRDRYIEQDVIQNYDFLYEDEAASIQNDAGDRNMFAGKRIPQIDDERDKYTELDVAQNYEIVCEEDASSSKCNAEGDRNIFAGKRRPQIDDVRDRYIEVDVAQNYEIVYEEDASSSICNAEGDRYIFAGKRRQQIDDVRDRHIELDVAQNYEIECEEDAESSRTIEAMSAISQSADEFADIIAGLSPSKKRKKVNVEMNPTYGYVYSTYHP